MPLAQATDGAHIHYERIEPRAASTGRSSPILLLGPLGLSSRLWGAIAPLGTERGYTLLAVDNRGCGRSARPRRPWTMRTMAGDAVAVLDHAGFRRAHVCGPSLGGLIAQEVAIRYPERVAALVLPSTTPNLPYLHLVPWRSVIAPVVAWAKRVRRREAGASRPEELLRLITSRAFADSIASDDPLWSLMEALVEDRSSTRGTVQQLIAAASYWSGRRLRRIRAPTQVLHGTADQVIPPRAAQVLARRIRGASLALFQGAGHGLILERPEEAGGAAMDFIAGRDRPDAMTPP